jgi:hypothetical protein
VNQLSLSERDISTLRHALGVAAERFEQNARQLRFQLPQIKQEEQTHPEKHLILTSRGVELLASQFDQQNMDTLALIRRLEEELDVE